MIQNLIKPHKKYHINKEIMIFYKCNPQLFKRIILKLNRYLTYQLKNTTNLHIKIHIPIDLMKFKIVVRLKMVGVQRLC